MPADFAGLDAQPANIRRLASSAPAHHPRAVGRRGLRLLAVMTAKNSMTWLLLVMNLSGLAAMFQRGLLAIASP